MIRYIRKWADQIRSSLWFIPTLLVLAGIALALVMVTVDATLADDLELELPLLVGAGADGAREMLGAVAMSMATIAGVTFSITILAVAEASNQYSPRILGNFMSDRSNQVVLGVFVSIFAYSLVVLRSVRGEDDVKFVPSLSVLVAVILALIGMGFLIFFIHHITEMLRISNLLEQVEAQTAEAADRLFPSHLGEPAEEDDVREVEELVSRSEWVLVRSLTTGYIQSLENDVLLEVACEEDVLVRMERGVGEFVVEGSPLASITGTAAAGERITRKLNEAYLIMPARTVHQDVAFGIRELVDVALKALSPAVNDTTTAITCVDRLSAVLSRLAGRRIVEPVRKVEEVPRVIARGPTFRSLLDSAFDEIRRNAEGNISILARMFTAIETIEPFTAHRGRRAELSRHVDLILEAGRRGLTERQELEELETRAATLQVKLANGSAARASAGFGRAAAARLEGA
jgi:uncharacterized membrane protein